MALAPLQHECASCSKRGPALPGKNTAGARGNFSSSDTEDVIPQPQNVAGKSLARESKDLGPSAGPAMKQMPVMEQNHSSLHPTAHLTNTHRALAKRQVF